MFFADVEPDHQYLQGRRVFPSHGIHRALPGNGVVGTM